MFFIFRTNMKAKKWGTMSTDSDSTLDGVYINIPSSSRQKPKYVFNDLKKLRLLVTLIAFFI